MSLDNAMTPEQFQQKLSERAAERAEKSPDASEAARTLAQRRHEKRREQQEASEVIDSEETITEDDEASDELEAEDRATGTDEDVEASDEDGEASEESEAEHDAESGPVNLADHFADDWEQARNEYTIPYRENGQDKVATLSEAQEALSKAGDYGTRNAAFKEERQTWEAERHQLEQQMSGTVQQLQALQHGLMQSFAGSPPDRSMLDANSEHYNPDQYHYNLAIYQENVQKLQGYGQQLHQHNQALAQQQRAALDQAKEAEMTKLRTRWPTYDADWPEVKRKFTAAMSEFGVTEQQLDELPTAASRETVRLALKAIETASNVTKTKRQLKKLPKLAHNRPGAKREPGEAVDSVRAKAKARVRKSGRLEDAISGMAAIQRAQQQ